MTETELIRECRKGNRSAFKELYDLLSERMMLICRRYIGDSPYLKDVFQEAFVKIYKGLDKFQYKGEGSLTAWADKIMVTTSLKNLRKSGLKILAAEEIVDLPQEQEPEVTNIPEEKLLEFIGELPDGYRTVMNLYVFESKSHKEIGEMLGISPMTSASQLSRARQLLIKKIKQYESENDG